MSLEHFYLRAHIYAGDLGRVNIVPGWFVDEYAPLFRRIGHRNFQVQAGLIGGTWATVTGPKDRFCVMPMGKIDSAEKLREIWASFQDGKYAITIEMGSGYFPKSMNVCEERQVGHCQSRHARNNSVKWNVNMNGREARSIRKAGLNVGLAFTSTLTLLLTH
jgi:hypothetical protein